MYRLRIVISLTLSMAGVCVCARVQLTVLENLKIANKPIGPEVVFDTLLCQNF